MITEINKKRTVTKHISCKLECKFDGRKCNFSQKWNNDKCWCECKNPKEHRVCKKGYFWNPATCSCKNIKYAESVVGTSVVICDKIIDTTKSTSAKTVRTKYTLTNFYILLSYLLITIALLIIDSC